MYLITKPDMRLFVVYFLHHLVDKLNDWLSQPNCHLDDIDGHNSVAENHAWVVDKVEEGLVVLLLDVQRAHDQLSQAIQGLELSALTPDVGEQLQDVFAFTRQISQGIALVLNFFLFNILRLSEENIFMQCLSVVCATFFFFFKHHITPI